MLKIQKSLVNEINNNFMSLLVWRGFTSLGLKVTVFYILEYLLHFHLLESWKASSGNSRFTWSTAKQFCYPERSERGVQDEFGDA